MPTMTMTIDLDHETIHTMEKSMRRADRKDLAEQTKFILTTWANIYEKLDPTFNDIRRKLENAGNENQTKTIDQRTNP